MAALLAIQEKIDNLFASRDFLAMLNLKKRLAKTAIASLGFVFAIAAGLALAALKKSATVKMEHAIWSQKLAFARSTGEESAAM
jgi:hypothetical protein